MEIDKKREKIADEAVKAWVEKDKIGTIEAITGIGKNFIFIKALYTCPKGIKVLFLAEQIDREIDVLKDIKKFKTLYGFDLLEDYQFTFMTYQSAYKLKGTEWDFVASDEIHDGATPAYSKFFFNNKYTYIIGLSATVERGTSYTENNKEFTKGDLIDKIAPVCYKYSLDDGQKDGTARPLEVNIIPLVLDTKTKNVKAGSKLKPFYTTEAKGYEYWNKEFRKALFMDDFTEEEQKKKEFRIRITSAARARILYKLPTKIKVTKRLLTKLEGKTLIFGNDLDTLLEITPNVVCSRYSKKENTRIREDFEKNKITTLASFKKLKQGANLSDLDNIIIMSYYSTTKDIIQRLGRLRKKGDKVGNVYILLTQETQEQVWFDKMFNEITNLNPKYLTL